MSYDTKINEIRSGITMTVLKTEDMHCEKCVERITKALSAQNLQFKVNLANKTVSLEETGERLERAKETLDDLGFEVIEF